MTASMMLRGYRVPTLFDVTALPQFPRHTQVNPYALPYTLPEVAVRAAPDIVQKLHELLRWTHWSHRTLGEIIGVSHPTVKQALSGKAGALSRSVDAIQRLDAAHSVVSRIYLLAKRDNVRTARAMDTPDANDTTAIKYLTNGQATEAYLTAMRILRPPQTGGMMVGSHPIDPRRASIAVLDED